MGLFNPNAYGNPLHKSTLQPQLVSSSTAVPEEALTESRFDSKPQSGTEDSLKNVELRTCKSKITTIVEPVAQTTRKSISKSNRGLAQSRYASYSEMTAPISPPSTPAEAKKPSVAISGHDDEQEAANGLLETNNGCLHAARTQFLDYTANVESSNLLTPPQVTEQRTIQSISAPRQNGWKDTNNFAARAIEPAEARAKALVAVQMPTSNRKSSQTRSIIPTSGTNGVKMSPEEKLIEAREKSLRRIQSRNRNKDAAETTSLRDLDIARKPVTDKTRSNPLKSQRYHFDTSPSPQLSDLAGAISLTPKSVVATTQTLQQHAGVSTTHSHEEPPSSKHGQAPPQNIKQFKLRSNGENVSPEDTIPVNLSEIRAEMDRNSAAGGSPIQSNDSEASGDSTRLLHDGRLIHRKNPKPPNSLADWEGKMRPPPPDWHTRSRFDNDNPEFYDDFSRWVANIENPHFRPAEGRYDTVRSIFLQDFRFHPDGLTMLSKDTVVCPLLAEEYGYLDPVEVTKYVQPIRKEDFADWGKLDLNRPENKPIKDETTEDLVATWIQNTEERRKLIASQVVQSQHTHEIVQELPPVPNPNQPILNIYLRPACKTDISQITDIYNWYVVNSPRTTEINPVIEDDIFSRLEHAISNKLPLIVAVENNKRATIPFADDPLAIRNGDPTDKVLQSKEKIVGWASAQDFTASDYVERISVELELFVDPAYRQLGVGRCLMDQLLESCDRGYLKRGGYHFHCPQEIRHLYSSGGGRDLHKMVIVLRKWKYPQTASKKPVVQQPKKQPMKKYANDQDDEYEVWLRKWLESWGFEVEGVLKGVGVKNGRFLDMVHLGKETGWQPAEGRIPEPLPFM